MLFLARDRFPSRDQNSTYKGNMNDNLIRDARNVTLLAGDFTNSVDAIVETDLSANVLSMLENQWGVLRSAGNNRLEREGNNEQCEHGSWNWNRQQKLPELPRSRFVCSEFA